MVKPIEKKLKNGMNVLLISETDSLSVNLLVLVGIGSKHEVKNKNGLAHFLEHMAFKGTRSWPTPAKLAGELDSLGARYNAFTGTEFTGYYITCLPDKVDQALKILSEMYLEPLINEDDLNRERGVIAEEINMREDDHGTKAHNVFMEITYGDQPVGWDPVGSKETLKNIKREDFLAFRQQGYTATNTTIIVSGAFSQSAMLGKLEKSFGVALTGRALPKVSVDDRQTVTRARAHFRQIDQTNFILGFRTFGLKHKDIYLADVLSEILGGGMSSRLFLRVREQLGAAYYVRASSENYSTHGNLNIGAGVDNARVGEVLKVIGEECARLKNELVSAKELAMVKNRLLGNLLLSLETPSDLGSYYGFQKVLTGKMLSPGELKKKIMAIKPADLRRLARQTFVPSKMNLAIVGPHQKVESFVKAIKL